VWVGWVVILSTVIGLSLLALLIYYGFRFYRRRRQKSVDRLLTNFHKQKRAAETVMEGFVNFEGPEGQGGFVERDLVIPFGDIVFLRDIATGASGKVSLGKWRRLVVAVKQPFGVEPGDAKLFVREATVHKRLRHPNVVQLMGICTEPLCVVMEFLSRGSLYAVLQDTLTELAWSLRLRFALDTSRGMQYLHQCGIVHRDLKSLNVFVDDAWRCKVGDFGTSGTEKKTVSAISGTVLWSAPELFETGGRYTQQSDVYAFGILLWEIYTRKMPFAATPGAPKGGFAFQFADFVRGGGRPFWPVDAPAWLSAASRRCWAERCDERPEFEELTGTLESWSRKSDAEQPTPDKLRPTHENAVRRSRRHASMPSPVTTAPFLDDSDVHYHYGAADTPVTDDSGAAATSAHDLSRTQETRFGSDRDTSVGSQLSWMIHRFSSTGSKSKDLRRSLLSSESPSML